MEKERTLNVSLICTVYNEGGDIVQFLEGVAQSSKLPDEFIIVDGGSTDGTTESIRSFIEKHEDLNIRLIESTRRINVAKGRNIAISNSRNEIIAVTDAGCIIDKRWLEEITRPFFEQGGVDVVSGWFKPIIETPFHKKAAEVTVLTLDDINPENFLPSSRSVAFKKTCWEKAGRYPEYLKITCEDTLFDLNLKKAGFKFTFVPEAIVYWRMRDNLRALMKQYHWYAYGDGEARIFTKKYLGRFLILLFPPVMILVTKRKHKHFWLRYLLYWATMTGWIRGFLKIR